MPKSRNQDWPEGWRNIRKLEPPPAPYVPRKDVMEVDVTISVRIYGCPSVTKEELERKIYDVLTDSSDGRQMYSVETMLNAATDVVRYSLGRVVDNQEWERVGRHNRMVNLPNRKTQMSLSGRNAEQRMKDVITHPFIKEQYEDKES